MTPQRRLLLASLMAAWVGMVLACGGGGSEKTMPYEVLEKKHRPDGKFIMSLLVSETATKEDVMKLAESLRREHAGKIASISIFDSSEAWRRHLDETYPEKELSRHWLLVIDGDRSGGEEIRWVAEGRNSPKVEPGRR